MNLTLPTHLETNGHICFYGFDVLTEWLVDYARKNWEDAEQYDNPFKAAAMMDLLRVQTGIKGLLFESALVDVGIFGCELNCVTFTYSA
jgi:hypothetical protein